jgi:uncharacterized membrane protein
MTSIPTQKRPVALALVLIVTGIVGWYSAFELTVTKINALVNPTAGISCDFSIVVQCGKNLDSWQGSLFGFPNPLIGLGAFVAPIVVGAALLAGARFSRWFWVLFNLGVVAAMVFVVWLISQSIFELGTLCVWCMAVWSITIPMFWTLILYSLGSGQIPTPRRARLFFSRAFGWVPLITLISYLIIAIIAQLRLDVIAYL